jgi:hypothetical protein
MEGEDKREYPHKDKPLVISNWKEGRHPKECKGNCFLSGMLILECERCGWSEGPYGDV